MARHELHEAWMEVAAAKPFDCQAICLLPEHLHCIWRLPEGDCDYPGRWQKIKPHFSKKYLLAGGTEGHRNESHQRKGERAIWQRRYWEHFIRDEVDYIRHFDYIHYNPVKHGYVLSPREWPFSSFKKYVGLGYYPLDWGSPIVEFKDSDIYGE